MSILTQLTETQRKAVTHLGSPLLIVAGPGSGKTRVLTHRIAYLVKYLGTRPEQILGLTFTRKAAREMSKRVCHLLGDDNAPKAMNTFHALCLRILKTHRSHLGLAPDFTINNQEKQRLIMSHVIRDAHLDPDYFPAEALWMQVSHIKRKGITPHACRENAVGDFQRILADIYSRYQAYLKKNNTIDLDDLIPHVIELFEKESTVLEHYRHQYQHLLVDEYQDITPAQYQLISLLAHPHQNISLVGDPDQMIFRWRGVDEDLIQRFRRDYPTAKVIHLSQNFRSTRTILRAAKKLRGCKGKWKEVKPLWTTNTKGKPIIFHQPFDKQAEADYIASTIGKLKTQGIGYEEMAVLVRTHKQMNPIQHALKCHGLPHEVIEHIHSHCPKDAIALLTLHKAKGLEFSVVFMPGMVEGGLPHIKSLSDRQLIDDERRLCYVGVSRAKSRLYLTAAKHLGRTTRHTPPETSRFIKQILPVSRFWALPLSRLKGR